MSIKNTANTYGSIAKFFHWLIFILVLVMLLVGFFMDDITDKNLRYQVFDTHKIIGITILILMVMRLLWALSNPKPVSPFKTNSLMHFTERAGHGLIYLLIIVMPISGWIMSSAAGHAPKLFNWELNLPITQSKPLAHFFGDVHYWLALIIIAVIGAHILAALYHHFVRKDDVLKRMLPGHKAM